MGVLMLRLTSAHLLFSLVIISSVVSGVLIYYGRVEQAIHIPALVGLLIVARAVLGGHYVSGAPIYVRTFYLLLIYWFGVLIANGTGAAYLALGTMTYLAAFTTILALSVHFLRHGDTAVSSYERLVLVVALIQFPFVLHQRYVVIPTVSGATWDSIVGTFGGRQDGGGASGTLMLCMIVGILVAVSMWQSKRMRLGVAIAISLYCLVIIALGETKAFFGAMPIALLVQQLSNIYRRPFAAITIIAAAISSVLVIASIYDQAYYVARYGVAASGARIDSMFSYFLDTSGVDYATGEVSRGASLALWWQGASPDPTRLLFGYGLGASRPSDISPGVVAQLFYPLNVASTSAAQVLWDSGIIGFLIVVLCLLSAIISCLRWSFVSRDRVVSVRLSTFAAIFAVLLLFLLYNRSFVEDPAAKILFVATVAAAWSQRGAAKTELINRSGRKLTTETLRRSTYRAMTGST